MRAARRFLALLSVVLLALLVTDTGAQAWPGSGWFPSGGGGGGLTTGTLFWPYVEMLTAQQANGTLTCHLAAGNQTSGAQFALAGTDTILGVRTFWFTNSTTYSLKCSLWDVAANMRLASGTIAVNATGMYTCTFGTAYAFSASQQGQLFDVTVWETTGAEYTSCNGWDNSVTTPPLPLLASPYHIFASSKGYTGNSFQGTFALFCGGDCKPTGNAGSEAYVAEPVWQ